MQLWIAGTTWGPPLLDPEGQWTMDIIGVFDSEAKAVAACSRWHDWIAPLTLNEKAPEAPTELPGAYYPLESQAPPEAPHTEESPARKA